MEAHATWSFLHQPDQAASRGPSVHQRCIPWTRLRQFKEPSRASLLFWTILQGALPTKEFLWRRRITTDPVCDDCQCSVQTDIHVLRDCSMVRQIWIKLVPPAAWPDFCQPVTSTAWILRNLEHRHSALDMGEAWGYLFRQVIHDIWSQHTQKTHNANFCVLESFALAERCLRTVWKHLSARPFDPG